ncbi:hypothetical protein IAT38_004020 [Cryptococcus sp. DSM 104549]
MDAHALAQALAVGFQHVIASDEACLDIAGEAEEVARHIARNMGDREDIVDTDDDDNFFDHLGKFWEGLAASFDPSSASTSTVSFASEDSRINLALAFGKLERNLVAGLQPFQLHAAKHEPAIRSLIFNITTFVRIEDPRFFTLQTVLTQLLSNLISPSSPDADADVLADKYLRLYLSGQREDDIIVRILDSKEPKTNQAVLHLLNNVTRGSKPRLTLLLQPPGVRWCAKVLGRMDDWLDTDDDLFELGASIFKALISQSLHPLLFTALSDSAESITPSQTTLLKLIDSSLASSTPTSSTTGDNPNTFTVPLFRTLSSYSLNTIAQKADDPRLPKVFEGLVLAAEILSSIGLRVQEAKDKVVAGVEAKVDASEEGMVAAMKDVETGVVGHLVDLLRALNDFFPRTNPRQPPPNAPSPSSSSLPTSSIVPNELKPFSNLKRDLVRLLGILTFDDTTVGDQVRAHEGIQLVLSLTEVDEGNPYLREHALFCIRNLMKNNPANQAVVKEMGPIGVLSDSGELLPLPDKMKKK